MTPERLDRVEDALAILRAVGLARGQQNQRSALTLLALAEVEPDASWTQVKDPLLGVTPIMAWIHRHYERGYAPNTRETIRKQTLRQFVECGLVRYKPRRSWPTGELAQGCLSACLRGRAASSVVRHGGLGGRACRMEGECWLAR